MSVGVLGVAQTKYRSENTEQSLEEMIFYTCQDALKHANLDISDVDSVVMASSDQYDGRAISMMLTNASCGGVEKNALNTSSSGEHALVLACLKILSGQSDVCLVASWSKVSEAPLEQVENLGMEPFFTRPLGTSALTATAMQVLAYQHRYSIEERVAADIVVKNRSNGARNPNSHLQTPVTIDEVLSAEINVFPLRELYLPPQSDGASALVLISEKKAKELGTTKTIWINGFGWARDTYWLSDRESGDLTSLKVAAQMAYKMAGIDTPKNQINFAEIDEITAFHEIMAYEALGFAVPGEGYRLIQEGVTARDGALPVNLSGGTLSSNPYFARGMGKVAEAVTQMRNEAGSRQTKLTDVGLVHASDSYAAQGNSVFILGKRPQ